MGLYLYGPHYGLYRLSICTRYGPESQAKRIVCVTGNWRTSFEVKWWKVKVKVNTSLSFLYATDACESLCMQLAVVRLAIARSESTSFPFSLSSPSVRLHRPAADRNCHNTPRRMRNRTANMTAKTTDHARGVDDPTRREWA